LFDSDIEVTSPHSRLLLKERQQEDAEYGDKPKFITSEYKRKLMEDQKWEIEDKIADEIDRRTGASSQGMHGFYANLLTKNIAMGGDVTESAVSAYTAGSRRQQLRLGEEVSQSEEGAKKAMVDASPKGRSEEEKAPLPVPEEQRKRPNVDPDPAISDRDDKRRKVELAKAEESTEPKPVPAPTPEPVISKAELILSAKERYLQRKRQQQQSSEPSSD
jgi:hypothetical protein